MMLMMDDAVVGEKAESVEKEYSALAREIEFRLTPYLYQLGIPPHVTGYSYLRSAVVEFLLNPGDHQNDLPADCSGAWYDGQRGGARDSPCNRCGMEQRRSARYKGGPVHGASDVPPQADKQGLHHRVCGYDPARIRHDNRSLSVQKGGITSVFASKRLLFCAKKQLPKSSCEMKTMPRYGASASSERILPADKARFSPQYCPFSA